MAADDPLKVTLDDMKSLRVMTSIEKHNVSFYDLPTVLVLWTQQRRQGSFNLAAVVTTVSYLPTPVTPSEDSGPADSSAGTSSYILKAIIEAIENRLRGIVNHLDKTCEGLQAELGGAKIPGTREEIWKEYCSRPDQDGVLECLTALEIYDLNQVEARFSATRKELKSTMA